MNGKYHMTYDLTEHKEGLTTDEVIKMTQENDTLGACDGVMLLSVIGVPGPSDVKGPLSVAFLSLDGVTGEPYTIDQEFTLWAVWTHRLAEGLPPGARKEFLSSIHKTLSSAVKLTSLVAASDAVMVTGDGDTLDSTVTQPKDEK